MTNQQGAPEAPKGTASDGKTELFNVPGYPLMVRAVDFNRLHAENEHLAALVEAQQPAPSAASKAVLAAIRAANMQLVRTGDDEFMLVTLKQATPQADSQPAPVAGGYPAPPGREVPSYSRDGLRLVRDSELRAYVDADRAARAQAADSVLEDAARESEYRRGYRHGYEQRDAEVRGALA